MCVLCFGRLWRRYDPTVYATIWGFDKQPNKIWELIRDFLAETRPEPNAGHRAIAALEEDQLVTCVVTQNVDNLHQKSGSSKVVEYHGSLLQSACRKCRQPGGAVEDLIARTPSLPPRCSTCGGPLKPSAVLFGENIPPIAAREAAAAVAACDVLIVVGTSATVRPASELPRAAAKRGAKVIEINMEPTQLTDAVSDMVLLGPAGETLPLVVDAVRRKRRASAGGGALAAQRPARDGRAALSSHGSRKSSAMLARRGGGLGMRSTLVDAVPWI